MSTVPSMGANVRAMSMDISVPVLPTPALQEWRNRTWNLHVMGQPLYKGHVWDIQLRNPVADPGFGKGGFMHMCTVATTPPYDVHAHRCNESGCCS